jgi:hypothetical protein
MHHWIVGPPQQGVVVHQAHLPHVVARLAARGVTPLLIERVQMTRSQARALPERALDQMDTPASQERETSLTAIAALANDALAGASADWDVATLAEALQQIRTLALAGITQLSTLAG